MNFHRGIMVLGTILLMVTFAYSATIARHSELMQPENFGVQSEVVLKSYLELRNRMRCMLNSNLCKENQVKHEKKRNSCLSGTPTSNCQNNKNNKEDLLKKWEENLHNPGK